MAVQEEDMEVVVESSCNTNLVQLVSAQTFPSMQVYFSQNTQLVILVGRLGGICREDFHFNLL
jgi:hypothetical protein